MIIFDKHFRQRIFWNICFRYPRKTVVELLHLQIQMTTYRFGEWIIYTLFFLCHVSDDFCVNYLIMQLIAFRQCDCVFPWVFRVDCLDGCRCEFPWYFWKGKVLTHGSDSCLGTHLEALLQSIFCNEKTGWKCLTVLSKDCVNVRGKA